MLDSCGRAGAWGHPDPGRRFRRELRVAKLLKKQGATIVSPENFMLFASMLPEAASGTLEPRHVVVPLRLMCPHADLVLGRAVTPRSRAPAGRGRDRRSGRQRQLSKPRRGPRRDSANVPDPGPSPSTRWASRISPTHNRAAQPRSCDDSRKPWRRRPDAHRRRELTFVFVGAGYAGVEALAELADLARDALRHYP